MLVWDVCEVCEAQATPFCNSHTNLCTLLTVVKHHENIKDIKTSYHIKPYKTNNTIRTHIVGLCES